MGSTRAKPELRTVTIAIVRDGAEAQAMQTKLTSAGIESFLTSERSYAVKKGQDLGARRASALGNEKGAVKVQVARSDVQRALGVLGATQVGASIPGPDTQLASRESRGISSRLFKDRDPTVPVVVVVFVMMAVLILAIS
ncbi:MAG TPA: hypothetical protein VHM64_25235 [Candidatus Binatia bacterium]|nr:hypothetical protein [Candidatus Binatia bacterium]